MENYLRDTKKVHSIPRVWWKQNSNCYLKYFVIRPLKPCRSTGPSTPGWTVTQTCFYSPYNKHSKNLLQYGCKNPNQSLYLNVQQVKPATPSDKNMKTTPSLLGCNTYELRIALHPNKVSVISRWWNIHQNFYVTGYWSQFFFFFLLLFSHSTKSKDEMTLKRLGLYCIIIVHIIIFWSLCLLLV